MSGASVRRLLGVVAAALIASGGAVFAGATAHAAGPSGTVFLVQALAGKTVDLSVDGDVVQAGAAPKAVVGPLELEAGAHDLEVTEGGTTVLTTTFSVKAGVSQDVVVHAKADVAGTPAVTVIPNNLKPVGRGKARLAVSHVAMAPPADIRVDGKAVVRNVANGESQWLDVPAKTYSVDVVPTTGGSPILEPVSLTLTAGTFTRVLAFGDPAESTADAIVQTLDLTVVGAKAPTKVPTGDGGQAAGLFTGGPLTTTNAALVALAGLLLLVASRFGGGRAAEAGSGSRHAR